MSWKSGVCYLLSIFVYVLAEDVLVTIPNGTLRGKKAYSARNISFYAFQQIPFAKPPVGPLRFKAPEPADKWEGTLDATISYKICYQQLPIQLPFETEDCLYLNVYSPVHPASNASLPVMAFIYGGGFVGGAAVFLLNGPHYFMENNVIIVTMGYRVGPFGFLTTGDKVIPGNYGLKDQNLALKWIRDNIKYFGGDPEKVTIFGQSAGGASVTFHLMSKKSHGLFRAAISQSATALCPWAYQRKYKEYAYGLATYLDSNFSMKASSESLLNFLQGVSADDLRRAHVSYKEDLGNIQMLQGFWFTPVVEPEHDTAFLTESSYAVIEKGIMNRVPLMIGICSEELITYASVPDSSLDVYDENLSLLVNRNMHITDQHRKVEAGNAIRKLYTSGTLKDDRAAFIRYASDSSFSRPVIHHAKLQSRFSDVYFYQFSYHGKLGGNNAYVAGAERVGHGEDSPYMWATGDNSNLNDYPAADILTSDRYRALLTNFAKTLNPTPEQSELLENIVWPKVTPDNFQYLNINASLSIETNPKGDVYSKWVELYEKMAVKPYDTF